jgi:small multidrug resistance pump
MKYRTWLTAAALYNLVWGALVILFPASFFCLIGAPEPSYLLLWQVVGMFVLVFAPGYWWAARDPARHGHLVLIGLVGKLLGPLGFAWAYGTGQLPLAFGLTILTNDLVWLPVFVLFVRDAACSAGGWRPFLAGGTEPVGMGGR